MISSTLITVCWHNYTKTTNKNFTKFGVKNGHGLQKKPSDFGGNQDNVTLGLGLWLGRDQQRPRIGSCYIRVSVMVR